MRTAASLIQSHLGSNNVIEFERKLIEKAQIEAEEKIIAAIQELLHDVQFFALLKMYGQKVACRFIRWQKLRIRLSSGRWYEVISPVFLRAKPKDGRRRKKRSKVTRHLGLELLGFEHRCSPLLIYNSVQIAVLCPSFDIATNVLRDFGVRMNHRLLQDLCYRVADRVLENRCDNVVDDVWKSAGLRLLICIDGGVDGCELSKDYDGIKLSQNRPETIIPHGQWAAFFFALIA